jgi:hypothetical protein
MLEFLRGHTSDRQLRLFACACCQSVQRFIPVGPCREAVEVGLRYADGHATADELAATRSAAISAADHAGPHSAGAWAAAEVTNPSALRAARAAAQEAREQIHRLSPRAGEEEARVQAGFLRDIVGNPFRPVPARSFQWLARHPVVREIGEEMYAGAPQEDMQLLAFELERLGCPMPTVLEHCRDADPHVRGCWVIDLILAKEIGSPAIGPAGRVPTSRVQEIREALLQHLGPKKYRRCLRKAVRCAHSSASVDRTPEWGDFVRTHPEYDVSDEVLTEVCTVCWVHGCELVRRLVSCRLEDLELDRNPTFLEARGTRFPNAYPEEGLGFEAETLIWWCPECQDARAEWMRGREEWMRGRA